MTEKRTYKTLVALLILLIALYFIWWYYQTSYPAEPEKSAEEKALQALTAPKTPTIDDELLTNHHDLTASEEEPSPPNPSLNNQLTAPN